MASLFTDLHPTVFDCFEGLLAVKKRIYMYLRIYSHLEISFLDSYKVKCVRYFKGGGIKG